MMQLAHNEYMSPSVQSVTSSSCLYSEIDEWCEDVTQFPDELYDTVPYDGDSKSHGCDDGSAGDYEEWTSTNSSSDRSKLDADTTYQLQSPDGERMKRVCLVCGDTASGLHYGIASCEACKAFFKRTVQGRIAYVCPANGRCEITRKRRKSCQACRFEKCIVQGMNPDGIRPDRSKGGRYKVQKCSPSDDVTRTPYTVSQAVHPEANRLLYEFLKIEPQTVFASPDSTVNDCETKTMATLSKLADRELVATIAWAKQAPGFSSLPLADQMTLLQKTWIDVLYLNFSFRSALQRTNDLVFSDDFKISSVDMRKFGLPIELCNLSQQMSRKLASLSVNKEEYILLKAMLLFNPDVGVVDQRAVESARHLVYDALLYYERVRGCRSGRRVGDLLLALPLLTRLVAAARNFWRDVKSRGHTTAHRLLGEMVEHVLQL